MKRSMLTAIVMLAVLIASAATVSATEVTLEFAINGALGSGSITAALDSTKTYDFEGSAQTGLTAKTFLATGSAAGNFVSGTDDYVWLVSLDSGSGYVPFQYLSQSNGILSVSSVKSFAASGGYFASPGITGVKGMKLEYGYTASNAIVTGSGIVVARVVPEPSSILALGTALAGLGFFIRRRPA